MLYNYYGCTILNGVYRLLFMYMWSFGYLVQITIYIPIYVGIDFPTIPYALKMFHQTKSRNYNVQYTTI